MTLNTIAINRYFFFTLGLPLACNKLSILIETFQRYLDENNEHKKVTFVYNGHYSWVLTNCIVWLLFLKLNWHTHFEIKKRFVLR